MHPLLRHWFTAVCNTIPAIEFVMLYDFDWIAKPSWLFGSIGVFCQYCSILLLSNFKKMVSMCIHRCYVHSFASVFITVKVTLHLCALFTARISLSLSVFFQFIGYLLITFYNPYSQLYYYAQSTTLPIDHYWLLNCRSDTRASLLFLPSQSHHSNYLSGIWLDS